MTGRVECIKHEGKEVEFSDVVMKGNRCGMWMRWHTCGSAVAHVWQCGGTRAAMLWHTCGSAVAHVWQCGGTRAAVRW